MEKAISTGAVFGFRHLTLREFIDTFLETPNSMPPWFRKNSSTRGKSMKPHKLYGDGSDNGGTEEKKIANAINYTGFLFCGSLMVSGPFEATARSIILAC